jgi:hypothetical protein
MTDVPVVETAIIESSLWTSLFWVLSKLNVRSSSIFILW